MGSQHCEVMAGLGAHFHGHLLVVLGHQSIQEASGLLGDALFSLVDRAAALIDLFAVFPQSDLPHNALKELMNIVVEGGGGFYELAVEHHGASPTLCHRRPGLCETIGLTSHHIMVALQAYASAPCQTIVLQGLH